MPEIGFSEQNNIRCAFQFSNNEPLFFHVAALDYEYYTTTPGLRLQLYLIVNLNHNTLNTIKQIYQTANSDENNFNHLNILVSFNNKASTLYKDCLVLEITSFSDENIIQMTVEAAGESETDMVILLKDEKDKIAKSILTGKRVLSFNEAC